ncbi:forkhead box transcription factor [Candidatus Gracilibacteria bacterium]|nr:forkhead box transcription factor [Candidatus Gracilibacteria bacterium]
MSINIPKNVINFFNNHQYIYDVLSQQSEDPFCKVILQNNVSFGLNDEIEVFDNNNSLGFFTVSEVFNYLLKNYPFFVTVPEEYGETLLGEGKMYPVCPSDDYRYGFKGTIGREPFVEKNKKRFLVKINNLSDFKLYPYLTGQNHSFYGVGFLPVDQHTPLSLGKDYEVMGLFSGNDLQEGMYMNNTKNRVQKCINA